MKTYDDLMEMAKMYGVEDNALFIAAVNQYALQQRVLDNIRKALDEEDSLMTTKEYVKGRENVYANPLVKELPKHADSANKTAATIIDIIQKLGHEPKAVGELEKMMNE